MGAEKRRGQPPAAAHNEKAGYAVRPRAPHLTPVRPAGLSAPARDAQPIDAGQFRQALGRHPAGVAIVTLAGPAGLTVTSFSSASLDPPLVSFYIGHGSSNWPAVQQARHFAVNLMGHNHQDTAARFALIFCVANIFHSFSLLICTSEKLNAEYSEVRRGAQRKPSRWSGRTAEWEALLN
jgi:hypothetical protein